MPLLSADSDTAAPDLTESGVISPEGPVELKPPLAGSIRRDFWQAKPSQGSGDHPCSPALSRCGCQVAAIAGRAAPAKPDMIPTLAFMEPLCAPPGNSDDDPATSSRVHVKGGDLVWARWSSARHHQLNRDNDASAAWRLLLRRNADAASLHDAPLSGNGGSRVISRVTAQPTFRPRPTTCVAAWTALSSEDIVQHP